ncbi:hypothetical protein X777_02389 [Ooceraea biroi]|uniref:Uncharacterized protein n=1 Tax=Ooceraea biroi TaxID=2015173 RepID=A0A026VV73_OOCBI|nr:hypothetical protein X777_02389 [Ooceraea biroi]
MTRQRNEKAEVGRGSVHYPFNFKYREEHSPIDFMQITRLVGQLYVLVPE